MSTRHRLLRLEHAMRQRAGTISRVEPDPRLELLKRLEGMGERLVHVVEPHAIERMSPAERMVRLALEAGPVGTDKFRRELGEQLAVHVEEFRRAWPV